MPYAAAGCLVAIWCLLMPIKFRMERQGHTAASILVKTVTTLLIAGFAALFIPYTDESARLILIGLLVCAAADAMLEIKFEVGGVLFFFGHVLYVLGFMRMRQLTWWSLPVFTLLFAMLLWFLSRYREPIDRADKRLKYCLGLYAVALASMVATALPMPVFAFSMRTLFAALGAVLFLISDMTLCRNSVQKRPEKDQFISLGFYYTGQLLIALSAVCG